MIDLSLNVLDIAENSVKARADLITVAIEKQTAQKRMSISVSDNGCGMTQEQLSRVVDPFYTTRTTRKVGLGVPFFKMSAEQTGGSFSIQSQVGKGTVIQANYCYDHIDMMPLGDMAQTMTALISVNPEIDFVYSLTCDGRGFAMDTREIKAVLEGVPVNGAEVLVFIRDLIHENQAELDTDKI